MTSSFWPLQAHFATHLPELLAPFRPTPLTNPQVVAINEKVAASLQLKASDFAPASVAHYLSGSAIPPNAKPGAMAYAGHQFGHFVPLLGDGRAVLLGELIDSATGELHDVHLKGSGPTLFARRGDGRATIGSVIREYLVSEGMAACGIPTTRSLAIVATNQTVIRHEAAPGGVLVRTAKSHIRIGTFELVAVNGDRDLLSRLTLYCLKRYYPEVSPGTVSEQASALLAKVVEHQATLIAQWLNIGFVHGVMNTDNVSIAGETLDYGPCAFMENYDPKACWSAIDTEGRYAYCNQPSIALWNLTRLAAALNPILDDSPDEASDIYDRIVAEFTTRFRQALSSQRRLKFGLIAPAEPGDEQLMEDFYAILADEKLDFTQSHALLTEICRVGKLPECSTDIVSPRLGSWLQLWWARLGRDSDDQGLRLATMTKANPVVIPRNHLVAKAIVDVERENCWGFFHRLAAALKTPHSPPNDPELALPAKPGEVVERTFCGT